jgi:hypothetical protein
MSETPRTDALSEIEWKGTGREFAQKLERELSIARKGLVAVADLIDQSEGVYGLHLNGDGAPWADLRTGGGFEEWLVAFDDALNAARSSNPQVSRDGGKEVT